MEHFFFSPDWLTFTVKRPVDKTKPGSSELCGWEESYFQWNQEGQPSISSVVCYSVWNKRGNIPDAAPIMFVFYFLLFFVCYFYHWLLPSISSLPPSQKCGLHGGSQNCVYKKQTDTTQERVELWDAGHSRKNYEKQTNINHLTGNLFKRKAEGLCSLTYLYWANFKSGLLLVAGMKLFSFLLNILTGGKLIKNPDAVLSIFKLGCNWGWAIWPESIILYYPNIILILIFLCLTRTNS